MNLCPVILSGGEGARLWPLARGGQPKQFLPFFEGRSTFQETALRAAALPGVAEIAVVTGAAHYETARRQLDDVGVRASFVLEPGPRDSAAALAAAALWIRSRHEQGVLAVLSADNHLLDETDFREAIVVSAEHATTADAIVTLGMAPRSPSSAYGYIHPTGAGLVRKAAAFIEKPDTEQAAELVAAGWLWNSGVFVARPEIILSEFASHAPEVLEAVEQSVAESAPEDEVTRLGPAFLTSPKLSIDYAIMERTEMTFVRPTTIHSVDVGSWASLWELAEKDAAGNVCPDNAILVDSRDVLVSSPPEVTVAVVGGVRLAVIVEGSRVLVCALDQAQLVRQVAAREEG